MMAIGRLIRQTSSQLFGRYLLVTNTVSNGVLMGVGDIAVQSTERYLAKDTETQTKTHDWKRTGRMCIVGVMLGPICHGWYTFLDKILPLRTTTAVGKKILLDQIVASPAMAFTFFIGAGTLEGGPFQENVKEFKGKFWTVYKADWSLWPPAQFVNFYFVPSQYRVIYVSFVTLVWNTFLSYMKHQEEH